jgi:hypothetical protein
VSTNNWHTDSSTGVFDSLPAQYLSLVDKLQRQQAAARRVGMKMRKKNGRP